MVTYLISFYNESILSGQLPDLLIRIDCEVMDMGESRNALIEDPEQPPWL